VPFEELLEFDPVKGHPLIYMECFVEGWRPGMMPSQELTDREKHLDGIDGFPILDPHKIGRAEMTDVTNDDEWDRHLHTPYDVASLIKNAIHRWYFGGGGNNDKKPTPPVIPSNSKPIKVA
jgi:hypothetical protein